MHGFYMYLLYILTKEYFGITWFLLDVGKQIQFV